ncbi:MAG: hypothetical protein ABI679_07160 [Gemmatimonadota bacterium]
MTLDGRIGSSATGFLVYVALFALVANWIERRRNPQPPPERYLRNPNDIPIIASWNIFSSEKWTEEGLTFHRRRLLFIPIALSAFGLGWLIVDSIW